MLADLKVSESLPLYDAPFIIHSLLEKRLLILDTDTMTLKNKPVDQAAQQLMKNLSEQYPLYAKEYALDKENVEAEHIMKPLTVIGQIVLDLFMGYGTNGIAALKLNRKFIGIEIDKEHCVRASQRLHSLN